jgi:hypothetical protein
MYCNLVIYFVASRVFFVFFLNLVYSLLQHIFADHNPMLDDTFLVQNHTERRLLQT